MFAQFLHIIFSSLKLDRSLYRDSKYFGEFDRLSKILSKYAINLLYTGLHKWYGKILILSKFQMLLPKLINPMNK